MSSGTRITVATVLHIIQIAILIGGGMIAYAEFGEQIAVLQNDIRGVNARLDRIERIQDRPPGAGR